MSDKPSIDAMRNELKLLGMERRDQLEIWKKTGKRTPAQIAWTETRLAIFREAYLTFCDLTGAKP